MSGPIVRKYGFPNFEQIFGKRELEHGADEDDTPEPDGVKTATTSGLSPVEDPATARGPGPGPKQASA